MVAKPNKILVFGATSAIAYETCKLFAQDSISFYLAARNENELKRISNDLTVRGAKEVEYMTFEALDTDSITQIINKSLSKFPDLDGLLVAHGTLPDQKVCETNISAMKDAININFMAAAIILTLAAAHFEKQGFGTVVAISSVAGDRGRKSNYIYGSAKSALTTFLSGLRQRLSKKGVRVLTVKPGFVDTPMTTDFKKGVLFVRPTVIANGIYKAVIHNKDIVYLPWFWLWIMILIKSIPEKIFKKINL